MIDRGRLGRKLGRGGGHVFSSGTRPVEADQAIDLTARDPALRSRAGGHHHPGQVMTWDGRPALRPAELASGDSGSLHLHQQLTRPWPGDGDGFAGQAGRVRARGAHGAHCANGTGHRLPPCLLSGAGTRAARQASAGEAWSAKDLLARAHTILPAPGQVDLPLGRRAHGLGDLAILTEVLDDTGHLDVHHVHSWLSERL